MHACPLKNTTKPVHASLWRQAEWLATGLALAAAVWTVSRQVIEMPDFYVDHLEYAVLNMGRRLLAGEPMWPDPISGQATAYLYPPLAPAMLAMAESWAGLAGARVLSLLSFLGAALGMAWILRPFGVARAILVASAFVTIAASIDPRWATARVDSLFLLCLATMEMTAASSIQGRQKMIFIGVGGALAILTKQQGVALVLPFILILLKDRRLGDATLTAGIAVLAPGLTGIVAHIWSNGWSTTTMSLALFQPWILSDRHWTTPVILALTACTLFAVFAIASARDLRKSLTLMLLAAACVATFCKWGGSMPNFLPLLWLSMVYGQSASRWRMVLPMLVAVMHLLLPMEKPGWAERAYTTTLVRSIRNQVAPAADSRPVLVLSYQETADLLQKDRLDDLGAAIEFDFAGVPVLARIATQIQSGAYGCMMIPNVEPIRVRAATAELLGRQRTAAALRDCATAIQAYYEPLPAFPAMRIPVSRPR